MNTSDKLRKTRLKKGFTQKQLADKLGVSYVMIGKYENGKRNPKLETIKRIADALQVSYTELLTDFPTQEVVKELNNQIREEEHERGIYHIVNKLERLGYAVGLSFDDIGGKVTISNKDEVYRLNDEELKKLEQESDDFLIFKLRQYKQ